MEGKIKIIKVGFTYQQNEFLKLCNLYHSKLCHIFASGALDLSGGRAIIDFDDGNNISNIKREMNYHPKKFSTG